MNRFLYFVCACILIPCLGCVSSGKVNKLENRIVSLEMEKTRQIKENQSQKKIIGELQQNSEFTQKNYAALKAQLVNYRATIQRLKGIIEETGHKFTALDKNKEVEAKNEKIEELNNKVLEISKHIIELEQYIGLESSKDLPDQNAESKSSTTDKPGQEDLKADIKKTEETSEEKLTSKIKDPEAIYKNAKSLLDKEQYDAARLEFERFISLFPDSKNADNARFWIAETYFREKWYEKSILEYQKVIEKYSTGNKVAAALLKQGYSFAELGEKANARLILKELIKKYPDSKEASFAGKKLESLK